MFLVIELGRWYCYLQNWEDWEWGTILDGDKLRVLLEMPIRKPSRIAKHKIQFNKLELELSAYTWWEVSELSTFSMKSLGKNV